MAFGSIFMSIYGKSSDALILVLCVEEEINLHFNDMSDDNKNYPHGIKEFMLMLEDKYPTDFNKIYDNYEE